MQRFFALVLLPLTTLMVTLVVYVGNQHPQQVHQQLQRETTVLETRAAEKEGAPAAATAAAAAAASLVQQPAASVPPPPPPPPPPPTTPQTSPAPQLPPIAQFVGPAQRSKHAYVTMIHGIDNTYAYRGYLYNCLMMRHALRRMGSSADMIALLGFTTDGDYYDYPQFAADVALLSELGVRQYLLPRLRPEKKKVSFAEMALLKVTPWSFTNYSRLMYLDGDVLPTKNLDCYFQLSTNAFNTGNASPLNSGWYVAVPSLPLYEKMKAKAVARLSAPWDETNGWGTAMPAGVTFRNHGKAVAKWDFNGASLDQGLLFHTLVLTDGGATMLDHADAVLYGPGHRQTVLGLKQAVPACDGKSPMERFAHFTGRNKPWLQKLGKTKDRNLLRWKAELDMLPVGNIRSDNFTLLGTKIPLGLFHPNTR